MDAKRRNKLIKLFDENFEETSEWYSIENYVNHFEKRSENYLTGALNEEKVKRGLICLNFQHDLVYLGLIESLRNDDYTYLDNALFTFVNIGMVKYLTLESGYDHCISAWNLVPIILASNRFKDIEKIYPKKCGLSNNGMKFLIVATNLMMYLYYKEDSWREQVIKETEKYLSEKDSLEFKSIVSALYALVNKDFEQFSLELSNVCKGRKKTKLYNENRFSKEFSFYSLGLYNFANFLYSNEIEKVTLPDDENFLIDYHNYQKENNYKTGTQLVVFEKPLTIINDLLNVDIPPISLIKVGRKLEVDCDKHKEEIIKRIIN